MNPEGNLPANQRSPAEKIDPDSRPVTGRRPPKRPTKYNRARHWFPSLPFQRFQALFNSLFKVLCIFPSRYLFAIGLPPIFSFRWNLPPALSCNPKQLDSSKTHRTPEKTGARTGLSPSTTPCSKGLIPGPGRCCFYRLQFAEAISSVSSSRFSRPY